MKGMSSERRRESDRWWQQRWWLWCRDPKVIFL